jgi:hypothetical protein
LEPTKKGIFHYGAQIEGGIFGEDQDPVPTGLNGVLPKSPQPAQKPPSVVQEQRANLKVRLNALSRLLNVDESPISASSVHPRISELFGTDVGIRDKWREKQMTYVFSAR